MRHAPKVQPTRVKLRVDVGSFVVVEFALLGERHLGINVNAKVNGGKHARYHATLEHTSRVGREQDDIVA